MIKIPILTKGIDMVSHFIKPVPGILVLGGSSASTSLELLSTDNPGQDNCLVNDYPRSLSMEPSANFVAGKLVTCYGGQCEIYNNGVWSYLVSTIYSRQYHSSAQTEDKILLIGGTTSYSTEWISLDGSPSQNGPFSVRNRYYHCTIQLSPDLIVVTGGYIGNYDYVTEYHLTTGAERVLSSLSQGRYFHACGVYQNAGQQVSSFSFSTLLFKVDCELYYASCT